MSSPRTWPALLIACAMLLGGCENLRVYRTFQYKHLRSEKVKKPTGEREYMAKIFQRDEGYVLRVLELKKCEHTTVEIAEETARIKVTAPTWYYFVGLGAAQVMVSTPFWVLGARESKRTEATKHFLIGSLLFLVPGLAVTAVGAYYKLRAGVFHKKLGKRRRVKKRVVLPCGVRPAVGRTVRLGTRTGQKALGKTDSKGELPLATEGLRPLVRWADGKVTKVYFDVSVEHERGQETAVPRGFPVNAADLREQRRKR